MSSIISYKKIIGVDIDGVIAEFVEQLCIYYNQKYNILFKKEDFKTYNLWETLNISKEDTEEIIKTLKDINYFEQIRPVDGSLQSIRILKDSFKLILITSRQRYLYKQTIDWINRYFPNCFSEIYFSYNHIEYNDIEYNPVRLEKTLLTKIQTKADICVEKGVDIMIEDSLEFSLECSERGINVLLLDRPWNQSNNLPENIRRVYSWYEILGELVY